MENVDLFDQRMKDISTLDLTNFDLGGGNDYIGQMNLTGMGDPVIRRAANLTMHYENKKLDPSAVNPEGKDAAHGLFQFTKGTGKELGYTRSNDPQDQVDFFRDTYFPYHTKRILNNTDAGAFAAGNLNPSRMRELMIHRPAPQEKVPRSQQPPGPVNFAQNLLSPGEADAAMVSFNEDGVPANSPGQLKPGNISDLLKRPKLKNPDGSVSTISSKSFNFGNGETLIPTVVGGKRLSDEEAVNHYKKTGEHLGVFDTVANANTFATELHNQQEKITNPPFQAPGDNLTDQAAPFKLTYDSARAYMKLDPKVREEFKDQPGFESLNTFANASGLERASTLDFLRKPGLVDTFVNSAAEKITHVTKQDFSPQVWAREPQGPGVTKLDYASWYAQRVAAATLDSIHFVLKGSFVVPDIMIGSTLDALEKTGTISGDARRAVDETIMGLIGAHASGVRFPKIQPGVKMAERGMVEEARFAGAQDVTPRMEEARSIGPTQAKTEPTQVKVEPVVESTQAKVEPTKPTQVDRTRRATDTLEGPLRPDVVESNKNDFAYLMEERRGGREFPPQMVETWLELANEQAQNHRLYGGEPLKAEESPFGIDKDNQPLGNPAEVLELNGPPSPYPTKVVDGVRSHVTREDLIVKPVVKAEVVKEPVVETKVEPKVVTPAVTKPGVTFVGWQENLPGKPSRALYNVEGAYGDIVKGSTVTPETLIKNGLDVPEPNAPDPYYKVEAKAEPAITTLKVKNDLKTKTVSKRKQVIDLITQAEKDSANGPVDTSPLWTALRGTRGVKEYATLFEEQSARIKALEQGILFDGKKTITPTDLKVKNDLKVKKVFRAKKPPLTDVEITAAREALAQRRAKADAAIKRAEIKAEKAKAKGERGPLASEAGFIRFPWNKEAKSTKPKTIEEVKADFENKRNPAQRPKHFGSIPQQISTLPPSEHLMRGHGGKTLTQERAAEVFNAEKEAHEGRLLTKLHKSGYFDLTDKELGEVRRAIENPSLVIKAPHVEKARAVVKEILDGVNKDFLTADVHTFVKATIDQVSGTTVEASHYKPYAPVKDYHPIQVNANYVDATPKAQLRAELHEVNKDFTPSIINDMVNWYVARARGEATPVGLSQGAVKVIRRAATHTILTERPAINVPDAWRDNNVMGAYVESAAQILAGAKVYGPKWEGLEGPLTQLRKTGDPHLEALQRTADKIMGRASHDPVDAIVGNVINAFNNAATMRYLGFQTALKQTSQYAMDFAALPTKHFVKGIYESLKGGVREEAHTVGAVVKDVRDGLLEIRNPHEKPGITLAGKLLNLTSWGASRIIRNTFIQAMDAGPRISGYAGAKSWFKELAQEVVKDDARIKGTSKKPGAQEARRVLEENHLNSTPTEAQLKMAAKEMADKVNLRTGPYHLPEYLYRSGWQSITRGLTGFTTAQTRAAWTQFVKPMAESIGTANVGLFYRTLKKAIRYTAAMGVAGEVINDILKGMLGKLDDRPGGTPAQFLEALSKHELPVKIALTRLGSDLAMAGIFGWLGVVHQSLSAVGGSNIADRLAGNTLGAGGMMVLEDITALYDLASGTLANKPKGKDASKPAYLRTAEDNATPKHIVNFGKRVARSIPGVGYWAAAGFPESKGKSREVALNQFVIHKRLGHKAEADKALEGYYKKQGQRISEKAQTEALTNYPLWFKSAKEKD